VSHQTKIQSDYFFALLIILVWFSVIAAQPPRAISLDAVYLNQLTQNRTVTRTIYSLEARFNDQDRVVFVNKEEFLQIKAVRFLNENEISFDFEVLPEFQDLGPREVAVVDAVAQPKARATFEIIYQEWPRIESIEVRISGVASGDTLPIQRFGTTSAEMVLTGQGFFPQSQITFDDSKIKALNDAQNRLVFPPNRMSVRLLIDGKALPDIGYQRFTITNPYVLAGEGRLLVRGAEAPQITGAIANFIADDSEKKLEINGTNFSSAARVTTIPAFDKIRANLINTQKIDFYLTLPIQQENQAYRVVVTNPDGQTGISNFFFAMAKPLEPARAQSATRQTLFSGNPALIEVTAQQKKFERLSPKLSYEINFGANSFPVERLKNDSTLIARVQVPPAQGDAELNYHNFTVRVADQPVRWKGVLVAQTPPKVNYMTSNRIIHPSDTLQVMIKGSQLGGVNVSLEDPELAIQVLEAADDRIRFKVIAGQNIALKAFPLLLEKGNVKFQFDEFQIEVKEWEEFNKFVALETPAVGKIAPQRLWSGREMVIRIKSNDPILVKFYGREIDPTLGEQKIVVTGFLLDSVNTIRAQSIEKTLIKISHGNEVITWRFRIRQQIRSGDRIEIVISNPGNHNYASELFLVERHWFEAFSGTSSITLLKIPFGEEDAQTEILKNVAFGVNWVPWVNRRYISFDGAFLVGNPATTDSTVNIEVGFGLSAVLWNHVQIGVGTNLTGGAFEQVFMFLGTRFKLPLPN